MFGTYRTILALFVVLSHLGGITGFGQYAVFGFYLLSGYLMTLILHENYGWTWGGRGRYALNRLLRIAPPYWAACVFSVALIVWLGNDRAAEFRAALYLPGDIEEWVSNIAIILFHDSMPRLVPPAWALTVELFFYIVIGMGAAKSRVSTALWFAASAGWTVVVNAQPHDVEDIYYSIPAASLPFSTGAMIYHFGAEALKSFKWLAAPYAPVPLFIGVLTNLLLGHWLDTIFGFSFYVNLVINSLLVLSLLGRSGLPWVSRRTDGLLGEYSYPIYLVHWQAGLLLSGLGLEVAHRGEPLFFVVALPVVLLIAYLLTVCVERPIEAWRARVKNFG